MSRKPVVAPLPAFDNQPDMSLSTRPMSTRLPESERPRLNASPFCTELSRMYELFLVVGLPQEVTKHEEGRVYEPQILYKHPQNAELPTDRLVQFCFPDKGGVCTHSIRRSESQSSLNDALFGRGYQSSENSYVFVLTSETKELFYGVCVSSMEVLGQFSLFSQKQQRGRGFSIVQSALTGSDELKGRELVAAPRVYCVLSRFPFFSMHFDVLYNILSSERLLRSSSAMESISSAPSAADQEGLLVRLERLHNSALSKLLTSMQRYRNLPVPSPGEAVELELLDGSEVKFAVPPGDAEAELLKENCGCLFKALSLPNFLRLYAALLQECNVIFVSHNLGILTSSVLAVIPLLRPFRWQGLFIPILPTPLIEYLHAPVPLVCGVQRIPRELLKSGNPGSSTVIVDVDGDSVYALEGEVLGLPEEQKLAVNLREPYIRLGKSRASNGVDSFRPQNPRLLSEDDRFYLDQVLQALQAYLTWFSTEQVAWYVRRQLHKGRSAEQAKEDFVRWVTKKNKPFCQRFLQTQLFTMYQEKLFYC